MNVSDRFDPFNDRLSRDIRNSLSEAFVDALRNGDDRPLKRCFQRWHQREMPPALQNYIRERSRRYRSVLDALDAEKVRDDGTVVATIWNRGLFFEVHEFLEGIWDSETGPEREALKGLIQAAGAYVHREHRNLRPARRLAARAMGRLTGQSHRLARIGNLAALRESLENIEQPPPQLSLRSRF